MPSPPACKPKLENCKDIAFRVQFSLFDNWIVKAPASRCTGRKKPGGWKKTPSDLWSEGAVEELTQQRLEIVNDVQRNRDNILFEHRIIASRDVVRPVAAQAVVPTDLEPAYDIFPKGVVDSAC